MTFEAFLIDKYAEQYIGLDDDMPDSFNDWLQDLGVDEVIEYAEEWHRDELTNNKKEK